MKKLVVILSVMLLTACNSYALMISDSASLSLATTGSTRNMLVDQFDSALGTLTEVKIILASQLQGFGRYESPSWATYPYLGGTFSYEAHPKADIKLGTTILLSHQADLVKNNIAIPAIAAFDGTIDFAGTSGATDIGLDDSKSQTHIYMNSAELAQFIGTGTVTFAAISSATGNISVPNLFLGGYGNSAGAAVMVEYTYTPIPEPATVAILGLGAMGLFRRKRAA